jgi:hypothetical protein
LFTVHKLQIGFFFGGGGVEVEGLRFSLLCQF